MARKRYNKKEIEHIDAIFADLERQDVNPTLPVVDQTPKEVNVDEEYEMYKNYNYGSNGYKKDYKKAFKFLKSAGRNKSVEGNVYAQLILSAKNAKGDNAYGIIANEQEGVLCG